MNFPENVEHENSNAFQQLCESNFLQQFNAE